MRKCQPQNINNKLVWIVIMLNKESLAKVSEYYESAICSHGASPRGVDWNSADSQQLRFIQLCKIIASNESYSITDLGCGYGALVEFLDQHLPNYTYYIGMDISKEMIKQAVICNMSKRKGLTFIEGKLPQEKTDYSVASGIFNVKLDIAVSTWEQHIVSTLNHLNQMTTKAFAFNMLTSYSDDDKRKDYLYYADPCFWFDFCKSTYSRNIALLHDYELYEFTLLVRKT